MNELIIVILVSIFTGITTKIVDLIEDDGFKFFKFDKYFFAIIYGVLIGYIISNFNLIAPLWIGVIFALILARKIDTYAHALGLISALIFIVIFGFQKLNITFLLIFFIIAFIDEILNDYIDGKPILKNPLLKRKKEFKSKGYFLKFLHARPFLLLTVLIISIIIKEYTLFLAILHYDIGYKLTTRIKNFS